MHGSSHDNRSVAYGWLAGCSTKTQFVLCSPSATQWQATLLSSDSFGSRRDDGVSWIGDWCGQCNYCNQCNVLNAKGMFIV
jgi:hypothetical protein